MKKHILFLISAVFLLAACGPDSKITVRAIPSPTPLVWEELPGYIQEFLQNKTYEEALQWMEAVGWQYEEIDGLSSGSINASPAVSLAQRRGECFEAAAIFSLLAMKRGDTPYLVHISQGEAISHDIQIYQDRESGKWGFVDYPDYTPAQYSSEFEVIENYLESIRVIENYLESIRARITGNLPVEWKLIDWRVFSDRGVDWITTNGILDIYPHYAEKSGIYVYE
jgi:hypothetical protein